MLLAVDIQISLSAISIAFSTLMSIILVVVTIINAKSNNKIQQSISISNRLAAENPIKIKIFDYINAYGRDFYNNLTKPCTDGNLGEMTIEKTIAKVDEMNTNLYCCITLLNATSADENFIDMIRNLYQESEELYLCLLKCKNNFVNDIAIGRENMNNLQGVKRFVADCLQNQQNYALYAQNISAATLAFLAKYKEVFVLQEEKLELELKNFMADKQVL